MISPYFAQVAAIQQKLGKKYENSSSFSVKVSTVYGFQGREEDVIIISTAGSNIGSSIGCSFAPNCTNVALTRARYDFRLIYNLEVLTSLYILSSSPDFSHGNPDTAYGFWGTRLHYQKVVLFWTK